MKDEVKEIPPKEYNDSLGVFISAPFGNSIS